MTIGQPNQKSSVNKMISILASDHKKVPEIDHENEWCSLFKTEIFSDMSLHFQMRVLILIAHADSTHKATAFRIAKAAEEAFDLSLIHI